MNSYACSKRKQKLSGLDKITLPYLIVTFLKFQVCLIEAGQQNH